MEIDRNKKLFLVAHSQYDHACMFGEGFNKSGYDDDNRWYAFAIYLLGKGGWQVVELETRKNYEESEIIFDLELPQIAKGKNPEDFGYQIFRIFNTPEELLGE